MLQMACVGAHVPMTKREVGEYGGGTKRAMRVYPVMALLVNGFHNIQKSSDIFRDACEAYYKGRAIEE